MDHPLERRQLTYRLEPYEIIAPVDMMINAPHPAPELILSVPDERAETIFRNDYRFTGLEKTLSVQR
ncbi:hypothetical protein [Pseudomonas sp. CFBP 13719]|uniref:hypothetical protein n=1 Tax=Pseudomonas sp. CFBP 13719 TaxID=2775303 RepID=UPI00178430DB|nr:hypothetical protein [Pseudomonas sp. CFBP 13719]MBD8681634.1 hypothetical protein [Pseudomonas sp. CFBP 13719]